MRLDHLTSTPNDSMRHFALLLVTLAACASAPETPKEPAPGLGMAIDTPDYLNASAGIERARELPIGAFLNEVGLRVQSWTVARLESDKQQTRLLSEVLEFECARRQAEIIEQLETGPPRNRALAAVALGFAKKKTELKNDFSTVEVDKGAISLGPLLAAIEDSDLQVQANALMGLGILERPETPMEPIARALNDSDSVVVRSNAAFAITAIAKAARSQRDRGGEDLQAGQALLAREACLLGLNDGDLGVRTQCAAALGLIGDSKSIAFLGDRLDDEVALVGQAASVSLARLGMDHPELKGRVARLLADRLDRVRPSRREALLYGLVLLAGRQMGDNSEVWQDWARRLPQS